jgi:hypothetical protein
MIFVIYSDGKNESQLSIVFLLKKGTKQAAVALLEARCIGAIALCKQPLAVPDKRVLRAFGDEHVVNIGADLARVEYLHPHDAFCGGLD